MSLRTRISDSGNAAAEIAALRLQTIRLKRERAAVVAECDKLRAARDASKARLAAITDGAAAFGYAKPGVPLPEEMMPGAMAVSAGVCFALQRLAIPAGMIPHGTRATGPSKAAGLTGTARLAASIRIPSKDDGREDVFPG